MKDSSTGRTNKTFWLRLIGTLLALALLVYLLSEQGWGEILLAMKKISLWVLVIAFALQLVSRLAICGRWHVLLRGANLPVTFAQTTKLTFAGLFATNFLPTTIGGDVVRLAGAIQLRFDSAVSTASLVVDRLVGMAGMAMVLPIGLYAFSATFQQSGLRAPLITSLNAAVLSRSKRYEVAAKKWLRSVTGFVQRMMGSLALWINNPRSLFAALGLTWIHMLCLFASIWLILNGMGETVSFWLIAGMWSAVYFITLLPISINAYGLQELSLVLILTRVGGVSSSAALTAAILIRTLFMLASLPGAAFVPGIMAARSAKPQEVNAVLSQENTPAPEPNPGNIPE